MSDRTPQPCRHKIADHQHGTHATWQIYCALLHEGFSDQQALELLKLTLRSNQ